MLQMLVSGGVDSTVCAALLHRALQPEQVIALHIDNGFMRQDESGRVAESLRALGLQLNGLFFFSASFTSARNSSRLAYYVLMCR